MPPVEAKRTLVKSPPEVWAQVSDVACLAEQLGAFGEIRITRAEPESIVEWEGDRASGTVRLESSGWGTKVTITAEVADAEPVAEIPSPGTADVPGPSPVGDPAPPAPTPDPIPAPTPDPVPEPTPDPVPEPTPDPVPEPTPDGPDAPEPQPAPDTQPPQVAKVGFFARLFGRKRAATAVEFDAPERAQLDTASEASPTAVEFDAPEAAQLDTAPSFSEVFEAVGAEEELEPEPLTKEEVDTPPEEPGIDALAVLTGTLEHLGAAHHRPFSRG